MIYPIILLGIKNKMAVKMIIFYISLVLSIIGSDAAGELSILYSPKTLKFSGSSKALESELKEIFSAAIGLSIEENSSWDGLSVLDPFYTPEAVVEVYIDGIGQLDTITGRSFQTYPIGVDEYEPDTYDRMANRIKLRFPDGENKLVNIRLSDPKEIEHSKVFGDIPVPKVTKQTLQYLKYSTEEDYNFLAELQVLRAIADKVQSGAVEADNIVDFYYLRFTTLHALIDLHGPNSMQTKEAKKLLNDALQELKNAFFKAYDGSVLVTVVATDVAHTRRTIRAAVTRQEQNPRASDSEDYPAIFNIILWFSVVFIFSLVAIVYALMDMDPGRDSIIYRMTSTRIKKDN